MYAMEARQVVGLSLGDVRRQAETVDASACLKGFQQRHRAHSDASMDSSIHMACGYL
jgi:hypothetical protein